MPRITGRLLRALGAAFWTLALCRAAPAAADAPPVGAGNDEPTIAFLGLHGGIFEHLRQFAQPLRLRVEYVPDDAVEAEQADLARFDAVLIQHVRAEASDQYVTVLRKAKQGNPDLVILSISGLAERRIPRLKQLGLIQHDPKLAAYYGNTRENLRRLLIYVAARYLGQDRKVLPPEPADQIRGKLYHPDHEALFDSTEQFLRWAKAVGKPTDQAVRVVIAVHGTHLLYQQPAVVDALIRVCEQRGMLAVAAVDLSDSYRRNVEAFRPDVVIHTCHSRENPQWREKLGVPHLHSIFLRKQSIGEWEPSTVGLAAHELAFHIISQELLGAIEPQVAAGTHEGGGSPEAFVPIPERVEHLVDRAAAWARLRRLPNHEKRIAFIYYNRESGKGELMRGSATGMFMNGPKSMVRVLARLKQAGYRVGPLPATGQELIEWMIDHGRQIGPWAPESLDRLARSGKAVLVPVAQYEAWLRDKVPSARRQELIERWGPPPGRFMVWSDGSNRFIVIPRIDLGNVILLPQPLRGEAYDTSLAHDRLTPPPHHYLATYFWLQEGFRADAIVHFGTHGTEFILPGKGTGLSRYDWPDIVIGTMPNINPWVINNLGESGPARRRAYAVLVDHLVPPSVHAGLSDELANLHNDIDKWQALEPGALKEKFRQRISRQVRDTGLDTELNLQPAEDGLFSEDQIVRVQEYLHEIHNETTPVSLHVLGQAPPDEVRLPWIVTCLRRRFLEHLAVCYPDRRFAIEGDRWKFLRARGEEIVRSVLREGLELAEAIRAAGGQLPQEEQAFQQLQQDLALARRLDEGFAQTSREIDALLAALDGKFIAPGPANSPDRNPAVLPTGRNMYTMNPEEVPTHASWEIAVRLVDNMLADFRKRHGRYPRRVAFSLNSFATFQDYGVMEGQILYLLGVRPVWDERNLVSDLTVIPRDELRRPRIDVFISALGYYRDMLPSRMQLLDKAVRLVAGLQEPDNYVWLHTQQAKQRLLEVGRTEAEANRLAQARIFGAPVGQYGSAGYYYLVERSGEWDTRAELMETYLSFATYAYTKGAWGVAARDAYETHVHQTDLLLRSWSDRTRSPLSNKYVWYKGGSLSLAIKYLTGREPEWFLSDVRDPDQAQLVRAEEALRRDFRVRLFNRKWIEGMMREGYAGADQIAVHVANTLGWKIMREDSVDDAIWNRIVAIYVQDAKGLGIRDWFERTNPFAFQEVTEILLEAARKGYWNADEETLRTVAMAYVESVRRHGEGEGLRGGGNVKLTRFVERILIRAGHRELLAQYRGVRTGAHDPHSGGEPPAASAAPGLGSPSPARPAADNSPDQSLQPRQREVVGTELVPSAEDEPTREHKLTGTPASTRQPILPLWAIVVALALATLAGGAAHAAWRHRRRG